jgi:hypothetical protein
MLHAMDQIMKLVHENGSRDEINEWLHVQAELLAIKQGQS